MHVQIILTVPVTLMKRFLDRFEVLCQRRNETQIKLLLKFRCSRARKQRRQQQPLAPLRSQAPAASTLSLLRTDLPGSEQYISFPVNLLISNCRDPYCVSDEFLVSCSKIFSELHVFCITLVSLQV